MHISACLYVSVWWGLLHQFLSVARFSTLVKIRPNQVKFFLNEGSKRSKINERGVNWFANQGENL